jgi:hypothetical protein
VLRSFGLRIIAMFGNYCNTKSKRFPLIFYWRDCGTGYVSMKG